MNESHLAYICIEEFEHGQALRGAALVTDAATEPVEFRCTSAIRPTLLQRTLWGKRLDGYIASRLVGKPLLDALSNSVALVVVRKPEFVELRTLIGIPLVQLLKNQELSMASPVSSATDNDDILQSAGGQFEPIVLKVHRQHPDDRKSASDVLAEAFRLHNVLEPFERIKNALDLVHQQAAEKQEV